jgi:glycosyltransferase involved in cell wall biosynthesis
LQREFGLPVDQPAILMLGRLIEQKQPLEVVRAFAAVRRERACSLLVVGTGPLEAALRELVAKERIPDVAFAGFLDQTQIDRAYAAADVFVLFSKSETWGIVVHEAMNFGLPIVVSDRVGCAPDLVVEGGNGHVVPHGDREALARTLGRLLDSEEERRRLGRASVSIVDAYTYDRAYLGLVSAVARAVGAERWPAPTPTAAAI